MKLKTILASVALVGTAGAANAAAFMNGGFEAGTDPGVFTTLGTGSTAITGWTVTDGSVDYIGTYWQAQGGSSRSVDLAGNSLGTLSQTFDTVLGQAYSVTYWVSKNPDGGAPVRTGTISAGGTTGGFTYSASNDRANMNWQQETFVFVASGLSTTLSFAANPDAGCCFGPALDSVAIAAVPEPSAWALMILGFGMVGAGLRRSAVRRAAVRFA